MWVIVADYLGCFFSHPWKTIVAREHEQCEEGLDLLEQNSEERKQSYLRRFLTAEHYNTTALEQS
jgi:hypothetical protein